ncbi:MAG TPA: MBL fold metallo-hydrolase [Candidatus Ozemobacteraceae bacterium]|nr:MBL fold metallo-hydrolase [Candidatus Ozemobacteraceae bacterium]
MPSRILLIALLATTFCLDVSAMAQAVSPATPASDTLVTSAGSLDITFVGHGTLMLRFAGKTIHIDPYSSLADYSTLPKADLILVTHGHADHLDAKAISAIRTPMTAIICPKACVAELPGGTVMNNGDTNTDHGFTIEAVPAYNVVHARDNGRPFHPKGEGNGYVLTFGETRVYVAGDTENTPEMKALKKIDVAFLPMNLPYTMTPEMVADAARSFKPRILYPYHYGDTDPARLTALLADMPEIEVRIRSMR